MTELVPTRDAAAMYGIGVDCLLNAMRQEGVTPEVRRATERRGGRSYWWNPIDVLRARAVRAERWKAAKLAFAQESKHPKNPRARILLARNTNAETYRNKKLAPLAAARGITVKRLRIDLGIDKG